MSLVHRLCIWDAFIDEDTNHHTELVFGFDLLDPSVHDYDLEERLGEFQSIIDDADEVFCLDGSGNMCPIKNSWVLGFSPCNLTDDEGETLESATKKVMDLTTKFRTYMIEHGLNCADMTVGE